MAKKTGLGKGLGALIPTWETEGKTFSSESVLSIPVGSITPNPHQPRATFDPDSLSDLAESIRAHGIIQPLIVIESGIPGQYTLIAGERRLRAARLVGLADVPAIIRTATQQEQLEFALIENVQREDLNAMERAQAYQNLVDDFSLTHDDISQRVGKKRATVTNTLRLLNLPSTVQEALRQDQVSEGHARALLALPTPSAIQAAFDTVRRLDLNVRQTEALVRKMAGKAPQQPVKASKPAQFRDLEDKLRQHLGTRVSLQPGARGGSITIYYYSDEELNQLLDTLGING
ncbi:MAG: ParB/RepB/Spo0J family partition protein [Anaerolineaceae bacterium]|nr:ParB/RepB/Spo0J family partition protein [Anaerolineaceae bacterium]HPT24020.1 ParB/RepB/Spo0J family partition protein [Anaerolineaceae bacterium]